MNDDHSPLDPVPVDDDLVSAVLDGAATPAEHALVESSAEGRRRLEELRAAAAAVAEPVAPLPSASVDAMVARALDESATPLVVGPEPSTDPSGDEIARRRDRHLQGPTWRRALGAVAAVAAVVALVAGAAVLVRTAGGRSSSDTASSADSSGSAGTRTFEGDQPAAESTAPVAGPVPPDLGSLGDAEAVLDRYTVLVRADLSVGHQDDVAGSATGGVAADQLAPMPAPLGCPVPPVEVVPGERWSVSADAVLPGGPVLVMSNGLAPGANRVVVVDATTCAVLADRTI
jgi:hypothetical protein